MADSGRSGASGRSPLGGQTTDGGTGGRIDDAGAPSTAGTAADGTPTTGGAPSASGGAARGGAGSHHGGSTAGPGAGSGGSGGAGTSGTSSGGAAASCAPPVPGSRATNPLLTDAYTADPAPLVDGCTFYIACGHDQGDTGFVLKEWFVLSSTDLTHWTKQVALEVSDFRWANANAWAGQMVSVGGKYYWYVPMNQTGSGMAIGVAVADSALGPFKDALGKPLIDDAFEMSNMGFARPQDTVYTIDPTVFVDDDGQAYLHYGGFGRMVVTKLGADMTSISGTMREATPRGFFEAPYLIKRDGTYYVFYAAGVNPASIDYATSKSPLGPWTYGGRVLDPLPNRPGQDAATSHPGVAQFSGQWYLVYHLSNGPNGGATYRRQVALDKLAFNADGSIQKVIPTSGVSF